MDRIKQYIRLTFFRLGFLIAFFWLGYIILNTIQLQTPPDRGLSTPSGDPPGTRILLETGGVADVISAVQRELTNLDYNPGTINGVAGVQTTAAIMAFQHDRKLVMTGLVTDGLLKQLILGGSLSLSDASVSSEKASIIGPEARKVIRSVEKILADLGYAPGPVDGRPDPQTAKAIAIFEADRNLSRSGRISGRLIGELKRVTSASFQ